MNPLNNSEIDYSQFGGTLIADEMHEQSVSSFTQQPFEKNIGQSTTQEIDYSQFGGTPIDDEKPKKEKVGKFQSALYGAAEAVLGIPALVQYGVSEWSKALEPGEPSNLSFEQENPLLDTISQFPESEDETSRRIRTGVSGAIAGAPFGIPGIIAGLVGSQAGQTVREVYGKEGKFEDFGLGEAGAIGADILAGGLAGAGAGIARQAARAPSQISRIPAVFENQQTALGKALVKNTIQGEKKALDNIVNNFSREQIQGFEQQASQISPQRYTLLENANTSALKQNADNMFRNTQLNIISPLSPTPSQGATALQESANAIFRTRVLDAERSAYNSARESATNLSGEAPRTLEMAQNLRKDLTRVTPTPEQVGVISFLDGLISDLEASTPGRIIPASPILDASGLPIAGAQTIQPTIKPAQRSANELIDLVQRGNQAVNYDSPLRYQSDRIKPILATLRQEVNEVLSQNPQAQRLYRSANELHANNAEIWGTKFIKDLRFNENPEQMINKMKFATNMNNFKQAIDNPVIQSLGERLVVSNITESGEAAANRRVINGLAPELSPNARNSAQMLIEGKDPLSTVGGRNAVRNSILQDTATSVSTGKRPEEVLKLMATPKGYNIVRETLSQSPGSREALAAFERLFIEDVFHSVIGKNGIIDMKKARQIFSTPELRNVVEQIGGKQLVMRFRQLESFAANFERNMEVYGTKETQSLISKIVEKSKSAAILGAILHTFHVPGVALVGAGIGKGIYEGGKVGLTAIKNKIIQNPKAMRILEQLSIANSTEEIAKQLPRLIVELERDEKSE